jgi:hypothetical protein
MTAVVEAPSPEIGATTARVYTPPLKRNCTGPKPDQDGNVLECGCGCGLNPQTSWGFDCNHFTKNVLRYNLLPWQEWLNIHALEKSEDGGFRFKIVVVLVARQNGKTSWLKQLGLWRLFVSKYGTANAAAPGARLAVIAAQNLEYAEQVLKDVVDTIRDHPRLSRELINHRVCLDVSTPLLTANRGWTTMGDARAGDVLFHPDGGTTRIRYVNPVYDNHLCYRVSTSDGRSVVCDDRHLWTVQDRRRFTRGEDDRFVWTWETISTVEMLRRGLRRLGASPRANAFRLPDQQCLDGKNVDLPIDPYTLGYWLGDGDKHGSRITVADRDAAELISLMAARNTTVQKARREGNWWRIWFGTPAGGLWTQLRSLGVADDRRYLTGAHKHIPDIYLHAGPEQREELLAGLLDSDGSVSTKGRVVFTNTSAELADAVMYLTRSLGFSPRHHIKRHIVSGKDYGDIHRVMFTPHRQVFRLSRKTERISTGQRPPGIYVKSIEPVETRAVRCFKVDRDDGLFLAGRDLIPTHNTNGRHRAILTNRRYWRAVTASRKGGRSLSVDLAMLDELREHTTTDAWDAIAPATTVRKFSQIVCTSNAGDQRSEVLRSLRDAATRRITTGETTETRTGLFEWSVPTDYNPRDEQHWHLANPALGYLNDFCLSDLRAMFEAAQYRNMPGFQTEYLCQWVDALQPGIIPAEHWGETVDSTTRRAEQSPVYAAVDVNYDRTRSFIAIAARRDDGDLHIEIVAAARGTDWVVDWLSERKTKFKAVTVQQTGAPASGMIPDLQKAGLEIMEWGPGAEVAAGCARFYDLICQHSLRHRPAPVLDRAAASGISRRVVDGWVFSRRDSPVDVAPLFACAAAVWAEHRGPAPAPEIHPWPDEDTITRWEADAAEKYGASPGALSARFNDIEGTSWWMST